MTPLPPSDDPTPITTEGKAGVSRRRLVRAGVSAAPVLMALKSNSVLAGGDHSCVRPSSFSSLAAAQMQVSARRTINDDYACRSHGYWKNNNGRLQAGYKTSTRFLSAATGFVANPGQDPTRPGSGYASLNLQQVLNLTGNQNNAALARHVTAAFLSAVEVQNDPGLVMLTRAQCAAIWNGQGVWSPFAGTTWTLEQTMAYFNKVYGPAFL